MWLKVLPEEACRNTWATHRQKKRNKSNQQKKSLICWKLNLVATVAKNMGGKKNSVS